MPQRSISLKAVHITMPALLLQKPSKTSKSREALKRKLQFWERGEVKSLLLEAETIQQWLASNNDSKNIGNISKKKFAKLMGKGNINGALKFLINNMTNGILLLDGSGPSGLDADGWRKMLTLKVFGSCTSNLCKAIAGSIKYNCTNEIKFQNNITSLKTFIDSRLAPIFKNPGL